MACNRRLAGAKALFEPMLEYYLLDSWEETSVKSYSKFIYFHSRTCIWKHRLEICSHFVSASMCLMIHLRGTASSPSTMRQDIPLNHTKIKTTCHICFTFNDSGRHLGRIVTCMDISQLSNTDSWQLFSLHLTCELMKSFHRVILTCWLSPEGIKHYFMPS